MKYVLISEIIARVLNWRSYECFTVSVALAEEATEIWGGATYEISTIAKIEFLWRALNFKRGHGPPGPPFSAAYGSLLPCALRNSLKVCCMCAHTCVCVCVCYVRVCVCCVCVCHVCGCTHVMYPSLQALSHVSLTAGVVSRAESSRRQAGNHEM